MSKIILRNLILEECDEISRAFSEQGWNKKVSQYVEYFQFQESGIRDIIVAECNAQFAGYLTIKWQSDYPPFKNRGIPEIVDFNVLKKFQRKGMGTKLMDEAEKRIKMKSKYAGIGVGLSSDYGAAHILYVKRGYIPDGLGISSSGKFLMQGDKCTVNDDLVLHLIKELN